MTVEHLIERLRLMDPGAEVVLCVDPQQRAISFGRDACDVYAARRECAGDDLGTDRDGPVDDGLWRLAAVGHPMATLDQELVVVISSG
jgi:hypothetical protein